MARRLVRLFRNRDRWLSQSRIQLALLRYTCRILCKGRYLAHRIRPMSLRFHACKTYLPRFLPVSV
jgi:hypothetical protein